MLTVEIGYISCDWDPKNAQDDPNLIYREEYCEGIIVINLEVKYLYDINAVEQGILVVGSDDQQYISTVDKSDSDVCEEIYNNFFYDFELNDIKLFSPGGLEIILRLFKKNTYGNSDEIESLTDADCELLGYRKPILISNTDESAELKNENKQYNGSYFLHLINTYDSNPGNGYVYILSPIGSC